MCVLALTVLGCAPTEDEFLDGGVEVERSAITYLSTGRCAGPYAAYGNLRGSSVLALCCWEDGRWLLRSTTSALSRSAEGVVIYGNSATNFILTYPSGITCELGDRTYTVGGIHSSWIYPLVIDGSGGMDYIWGLNTTGARFQHHLIGGSGNDRLYVGSGGGYADGSDGDDNIYGGSGDDQLLGGNGDDRIFGGDGGDLISGEDGADFLSGGDGIDLIFGHDGEDEIYGDGGNDILAGQGDHDIIHGGDGDDWIYGDGTPHPGDWPDEWRLWPYFQDEPWSYTFPSTGDWDELYGENGDDRIFGEIGRDHLHGGDGNDVLHGGQGNDICYGEAGYDLLFGEEGSDELFGGSEDDVLTGGDDGEVDWCHGEDGIDGCNCLMEYTC